MLSIRYYITLFLLVIYNLFINFLSFIVFRIDNKKVIIIYKNWKSASRARESRVPYNNWRPQAFSEIHA